MKKWLYIIIYLSYGCNEKHDDVAPMHIEDEKLEDVVIIHMEDVDISTRDKIISDGFNLTFPSALNLTTKELKVLESKAENGDCDSCVKLGKYYLYVLRENDLASYWFNKAHKYNCGDLENYFKSLRGELVK